MCYVLAAAVVLESCLKGLVFFKTATKKNLIN